jgi:hypothetical protein
MAVQNAGWNCGTSVGGGLSRVLATQRYPAEFDGFASASSWLNSTRPDWVTNTEGTDRDYVSIGCATLFLDCLRYQLHISPPPIVQAGGTKPAARLSAPDQLGRRLRLLGRPAAAALPGRHPGQPAERQPVPAPEPGRLGRLGIARRGREL